MPIKHTNQAPLRLLPEPDRQTIELLFRTFSDVLIPLEQVREQYFRNLNAESFVKEIDSGRIQLPITTLDPSRKAPKYTHIRHLASLIDVRAYQADECMAKQKTNDRDEPIN